MRQRHWSAYLRLLPGGDNDVTSALTASGILYALLFLVVLAPAFHYARLISFGGAFDVLLPVVAAGATPALVLAAWTGLRVRNTQPIGPDEVAASSEDDRTWRGDEVPRVPNDAFVVSTGPRYLALELADGSSRRLWYRAGQEERQLIRLARSARPVRSPLGFDDLGRTDAPPGVPERRAAQERSLEDLVRERIGDLPSRLLPDPEGVEECLRRRLDEVGVVLTRSEVWER